MKPILSLALIAALATPALADENCEIVTLPKGAASKSRGEAKFHDAKIFLDSLYDDEPETVTTVEDAPILAVMCKRETLLPTMRDLPIIKTGLPFSLSQNFDSPTSGLLMIYDDGTAYRAEYTGEPALGPDAATLKDVMEIFNFQRLTE